MKYKKLANKVWKIYNGKGLSSNIYLIDIKEPALIDLGSKENSGDLIKTLNEIGYKAVDIKKIIFTHIHFDHFGDPKKFPNAKLYIFKEEIEFFKNLEEFKEYYEEFKKFKFNNLKEIKELKVIETPGHTVGSICLFLEKEKILFTGDTLFDKGLIGRTNLINSKPEKISSSLIKIKKIKYKLLCPGHDY